MSSLEEQQRIAAGVMRNIIGQALSVGVTPTPYAIWPPVATGGLKATQVVLRPVTNAVWFSIDLPVGTPDDPAAQLAGNVEYVFPVSPNADTMWVIAPAAGTILARWVIGD